MKLVLASLVFTTYIIIFSLCKASKLGDEQLRKVFKIKK